MKGNDKLIIFTGGTIGMTRVDSDDGFLKNREEVISEILDHLDLKGNDKVFFTSKIIDSSQIDFLMINEIINTIKVEYLNYNGFLIISGTDTMAYIQSLLKWQIYNLKKPIILTGAIKSYDDDPLEGVNNIKYALSQINAFKNQGIVGICMNNNLMTKPTTKTNSLSKSPFKEVNDSSLEKYRYMNLNDKEEIKFIYLKDIRIEIMYLNPFIYISDEVNLADGLIILTYGQGTINDNKCFRKRIKRYSQTNKPIVAISQSFINKLNINEYDASKFLQGIHAHIYSGSSIEEGIAFINYLISNNLLKS